MHGRPRKEPRPKDAAKAGQLRELQAQLLHNNHNRIYTKEALEACWNLLAVNLEVYTAWNYRKLAVQHNLDGVTNPDAVKSALKEELKVVALKTNPSPMGHDTFENGCSIISSRQLSLNVSSGFWIYCRRQIHGIFMDGTITDLLRS